MSKARIVNAHQIRIVGGQWKRTPIKVLDSPGLRPTPDRVRETLFNWLQGQVEGAHCLDLFAGSGALGLEALSRGAAHVHFNEPMALARQAIDSMLQKLSKPNTQTTQISDQDALSLCRSLTAHSFDLIFLDPPFRANWLPKLLPEIAKLLKAGAKVYAEAEHRLELDAWRTLKFGKAGQVHYHLLEYVP